MNNLNAWLQIELEWMDNLKLNWIDFNLMHDF